MYFFDLRLSLLPFSLLRITNTFRQMKPGEEIEIVCGVTAIEKATLDDVKRILSRDNYDIVSNETLDGDDPAIVIKLKKK